MADDYVYMPERQAAVLEAYKNIAKTRQEPTIKMLCVVTGETRRAVTKYLKELKAQGLLEVKSEVLTPGEHDTLEVLKRYIHREGYPPRLVDLADEREKSKATIRDHMLGLKAKGWITWHGGSFRTLQILRQI